MKFAIRMWQKSARHAYDGIVSSLRNERNMRIHFIAAIGVMLSCLLFHIHGLSLWLVMLAITLVIVSELFNTALEHAIDLITPEVHPLAKIAKDTADRKSVV